MRIALSDFGAFAFGKHGGEFASLSFSHKEIEAISTTSSKNSDVTATKDDRDRYADANAPTIDDVAP